MRINAESYRVAVMALLLGLLIGANNLVKILRDSLFLGHHSVSELPYLLYIRESVAAPEIAGRYKPLIHCIGSGGLAA